MKLKIRAVNESVDKQVLTEADLSLGYRLKELQKLNTKISASVKNAGYKYKEVKDTGFYILPPNSVICSLQLTSESESETAELFKLQVKDMHGKEVINKTFSYNEETIDEFINDIAQALVAGIPCASDIESIAEGLNEDIISEYGPIKAMKNLFAKIAVDRKEKQQSKAEASDKKKQLANQINEYKDKLNAAINTQLDKKAAGGKNHVKVSIKSTGDSLTVELQSNFLVAVTFGEALNDRKTNRVEKVLTCLGEVKLKTRDVEAVLNKIGNVLNITFKLDDIDDAEDEIPNPDAEVETDTGWETLIGAEAFAHLSSVGESIEDSDEILEAYKLGISADKYMDAFNAATSAEAKNNVVRYFLFKESAGKLSEDVAKKLDTKIVGDIADIIKSSKSFNPNAVFELLYILKFIQRHKKIEQIAVDFAKNLPDACKNSSTLENIKSIIYSETLFNSANDIATLQKLVKHWYTTDAFKKYNLTKLSEKSKQNLVDKFDLAADFVTKTEALELKKEILLDRAKKSFRSLTVIEALAQAIRNAVKGGKPAARVDDDEEEVSAGSTEFDIEALDPDTISEEDFKKLLRLATSKSGSAADRVKLAKALVTGLTEA